MAYANDMTKINLALSSDDLDRFKGIKAFTNIATDAEAVRYCIRATYLALCQDDCKMEYINNALKCISDLRIELLALIRE